MDFRQRVGGQSCRTAGSTHRQPEVCRARRTFVTVTLSLPGQDAAKPRSYTMLNPAISGVSFGCSRRSGVPSRRGRGRRALLPSLPGARVTPPPQGGGWWLPLLGLGPRRCLADRWGRASLLGDNSFSAVEACTAGLWGECHGWRRGQPLRLSGGTCQIGARTFLLLWAGLSQGPRHSWMRKGVVLG